MKLYNWLNEKIKQVPWKSNLKLGWWLDNDPMTFFHGTHISNIDTIEKEGLKPNPESSEPYVSLALEPSTAFGYACMMGGEACFAKQAKSGKAKTVPPNERAVLIIQLSKDFVLKNMAPERGKSVLAKGKLKDEKRYKEFSGTDTEYYQLAEIRIPKKVDPKYIKGYMIKR